MIRHDRQLAARGIGPHQAVMQAVNGLVLALASSQVLLVLGRMPNKVRSVRMAMPLDTLALCMM